MDMMLTTLNRESYRLVVGTLMPTLSRYPSRLVSLVLFLLFHKGMASLVFLSPIFSVSFCRYIIGNEQRQLGFLKHKIVLREGGLPLQGRLLRILIFTSGCPT